MRFLFILIFKININIHIDELSLIITLFINGQDKNIYYRIKNTTTILLTKMKKKNTHTHTKIYIFYLN